ncbi:hypothetical protein MM440_11405 [Arsenicicoccus piscis]|uniref:LigA protein n=1 Tax=Arsenicicoccus piscis TaxID=673954 RepID=A0ABQ6HJF9_9MICO|nr:hypothetical protein [Arsenicicoccus piscis]MCH8628362.1 hypothetical protein [Arsenicicoccus piscis]GMA18636.1 hypothetical protein GCM10025862_06570 [Arsenicicoccus piscis]
MTRTRKLLAALGVAATVPYLTLKLAWLLGSRVGLLDPEFGTRTSMVVANTLTAGLELAAAVLAVAFVARWGRRLPAWLVLLPMCLGTGFLAEILVIVPLQLLIGGAGGAAARSAGPQPIADWVFVMVYGCFCVLGVALLAGFACYAWERWGPVLGARLGAVPPAPATGRRPALLVAALLVVVTAVETAIGWDPAMAANLIGRAALTLLGALALVALAERRPRGLRVLLPVAAAWAAGGAMVAWGAYEAILLTVPNDLAPAPASAWDVLPSVVRLVLGLAVVRTVLSQAARGGQPSSVTRPRRALISLRRDFAANLRD